MVVDLQNLATTTQSHIEVEPALRHATELEQEMVVAKKALLDGRLTQAYTVVKNISDQFAELSIYISDVRDQCGQWKLTADLDDG